MVGNARGNWTVRNTCESSLIGNRDDGTLKWDRCLGDLRESISNFLERAELDVLEIAPPKLLRQIVIEYLRVYMDCAPSMPKIRCRATPE
jgi:hypothetical protein